MKTMLRVATYTKQYRRATSNQAVYSSFAMQRVRRRVLGVVSEPTLVFLGVADFPRCLHQVLLVDIISVGTMSIITPFSCEGIYLSSLIANIPASVITLRRSAPLKPSDS